jgi:hypothetical protein
VADRWRSSPFQIASRRVRSSVVLASRPIPVISPSRIGITVLGVSSSLPGDAVVSSDTVVSSVSSAASTPTTVPITSSRLRRVTVTVRPRRSRTRSTSERSAERSIGSSLSRSARSWARSTSTPLIRPPAESVTTRLFSTSSIAAAGNESSSAVPSKRPARSTCATPWR